MQPIFTTYEKAITKITKRREKGRKKLVLWISFTFYFYTVDWGGNFSKVSKKFSAGEKSDLQNQHILIQNSWLSKIWKKSTWLALLKMIDSKMCIKAN